MELRPESDIRFVDLYESDTMRSQGTEFLYRLILERHEEESISFRKPTWEEHVEFVNSRPYWIWFLIVYDGIQAGTISVTDRNEIGIVLLKAYCGFGIGTAAIKQLLIEQKPLPEIPSRRSGRFLANISPKNKVSRHMFEKLGFVHIQDTLAL